jgi:hypothetical protein
MNQNFTITLFGRSTAARGLLRAVQDLLQVQNPAYRPLELFLLKKQQHKITFYETFLSLIWHQF